MSIPSDVHAELARRAAASDMSLRAYLRHVLSEHVAVPSMDEWLHQVRAFARLMKADRPARSWSVLRGAEDDELVGR